MRYSWKRISLGSRVLIFLQAIIFTFIMINCGCHEMSFFDGGKIFLYQFFAWFLIGNVILDLIKVKTNHFFENVTFSYAFGGILSLLVYMVLMLIGMKALLPYVTIVEGVLALFYFIKARRGFGSLALDKHSVIICFVFLIIYYLLITVTVSFVNTLPNELSSGNGYYVDWPFWVGNNISLTKSFPAYNFRQVGTPLRYHYFSSILMAQVSLCTGVDVTQLSFYFSSILFGIFLIFSAYFFSTRMLKEKWSITLLMIILLFTDGLSCTFCWHINLCPFGFDIGYAYGMITLGILAEIITKDRFKELFIPSIFLIAMTTGCKGPVGAIVLVAYGVASFYYLLCRKIKRGLVSGFAWLGAFAAILFGFIRGTTTFSAEVGLTYIGGLDIDTIIANARPITDIYNTLIEKYYVEGERLFVKLYAIWLYVFRINRVIIFLYIIAICVLIWQIKRKKMDAFFCVLMLSSLAGILCGIYTVQTSASQMYFVMAIYPTAALAGMYALEVVQGLANRNARYKGAFQGICVAMIILLGLSANQYYETASGKFASGLNVIRGKIDYDGYAMVYVDTEDYEAFEWLKNNTAEESIFAIDTHLDAYGRDNYMMACIFSQRYLWNETKYSPQAEAERRDKIVDELSADIEGSIQSMKSEGVEYLLMQANDEKTEYGSKTDLLTEVFRNSHYVIYKL